MSNAARRPVIAGNWKMNNTAADARELASAIAQDVGHETDVQVVVCPPYTALDAVRENIESSNILLGAQNVHPKPSGAYTGEISAGMLREWFVSHVIIGHSERREYAGETDAFINAKVLTALENTLKPILCVGETLTQREAGDTLNVVNAQLLGGLENVKAKDAHDVIVAYEPVWAIGTGETATPQQAQEVHAAIRATLAERFSPAEAENIRIIYGGSMKAANAPELLAQADIDGGLIGGAALDAKQFVKIVQAALAQ